MKYAIQEHNGEFLVKKAWDGDEKWHVIKKEPNLDAADNYLQNILDDIVRRGGTVKIVEDVIRVLEKRD